MTASRAISTVSSSRILRGLLWMLAGAASGILLMLIFVAGVIVGAV